MRIPSFRGKQLAALMEAFDLTQGAIAELCGCSVPTVQRAVYAADKTIGDQLASTIGMELLSDQDVWLELGLGPKAIAAAEREGLPYWDAPVGRLYWRPLVHRWAADFRRVFPSSLESAARHLCDLLGVSQEEGLLSCDVCTAHKSASPGVAFRRCSICGAHLCLSIACGDRYWREGHDQRLALPVACVSCLRGKPGLVRSGAYGAWIPGLGGVAVQLEHQYLEARAGAGKSHLVGFRGLLNEHQAYFKRHAKSIRTYLRQEIPTPPGLPDFRTTLRQTLEQVERELEHLSRLGARINADLAGKR